MIHQLLIKLFIVVFVINLQLVGLVLDSGYLGWIAAFNLAMLVIGLFQHRNDIQKITPHGKRTLFDPSVFFLLSLSLAIGVYSMLSSGPFVEMNALRTSALVGIVFFVISFVRFDMGGHSSVVRISLWRILLAVGLLGALGRLGVLLGKMYGTVSSGALHTIKNQLIGETQRQTQNSETEHQANEIQNLEKKSSAVGEGALTASDDRVDGNGDDEIAVDEIENLEDTRPLRYGELIPRVIDFFELERKHSAQYTFSAITKDSQEYSSFLVARDYGMIGTDIQPTWFVKCQNLIVMIGLAQGWSIDSSKGVIDGYWDEALRRGIQSETTCSEKFSDATWKTVLSVK